MTKLEERIITETLEMITESLRLKEQISFCKRHSTEIWKEQAEQLQKHLKANELKIQRQITLFNQIVDSEAL
jgi:hypothetical protein